MFFTFHAIMRMNQRMIPPDWVLWAINVGNAFQQPWGNWRFDATYNNGANTLTVITDPTRNFVVTTWWS